MVLDTYIVSPILSTKSIFSFHFYYHSYTLAQITMHLFQNTSGIFPYLYLCSRCSLSLECPHILFYLHSEIVLPILQVTSSMKPSLISHTPLGEDLTFLKINLMELNTGFIFPTRDYRSSF